MVYIYRTCLELENLEKERSHYVELHLEDQPGVLCLHISITALNNDDVSNSTKMINSNSTATDNHDDEWRVKGIENEFSLLKTTQSVSQVGWMQV